MAIQIPLAVTRRLACTTNNHHDDDFRMHVCVSACMCVRVRACARGHTCTCAYCVIVYAQFYVLTRIRSFVCTLRVHKL